LGLGAFILLNAAERRMYNMADSGTWLCNLYPLNPQMILALLALGGTAFVLFAARPNIPTPIRWTTVLMTGVLVVFTASGLFRSILATTTNDITAVLFLPLSVLVALGVVSTGLFSRRRLLPVARPPLVIIPLIAVVTVTGLVISTVRSGMHDDAAASTDQPSIVVLVVDEPDVTIDDPARNARARFAIDLFSQHADSRIVVVSPGVELSEDSLTALRDQVESFGVDSLRMETWPGLSDTSSVIDAICRSPQATDDRSDAPAFDDPDRAADVGGTTEEDNVVSRNVNWVGSAPAFARIRLLAARRGLVLRCSSGQPNGIIAADTTAVLGEVVAYSRALFLPLLR
jgi:hypothetical protein